VNKGGHVRDAGLVAQEVFQKCPELKKG